MTGSHRSAILKSCMRTAEQNKYNCSISAGNDCFVLVVYKSNELFFFLFFSYKG